MIKYICDVENCDSEFEFVGITPSAHGVPEDWAIVVTVEDTSLKSDIPSISNMKRSRSRDEFDPATQISPTRRSRRRLMCNKHELLKWKPGLGADPFGFEMP